MSTPSHPEGMSLRRAAIVAGLCYLMPVSYAELAIWPKLIIPGHIEQTVRNITAHSQMFAVGIFCNLFTLTEDIVIAWALFVLLAPVNRALSLLTAWFRLIYTAIALVGVLDLLTVFRLLTTPDFTSAFGPAQLDAQVLLLLRSFRYDWSISLIFFGIHLLLLGALIWRSGYMPRVLGALLMLTGLSWVVCGPQPYFYPRFNVDFLMPLSALELLLPLWLLIRGWKTVDAPAVGRSGRGR